MPTEGERWARDQLQELLDARFAPTAIAHLFAESQRRSNRIRRERPALARQEAAWLAAGAAGYLVAGRPRALGWWLAVGLMLDWHLGMIETEDGRPRPLGAADAMTMARVWLVPLAADGASAALPVAAFVTDALDGRLARASQPTRIGRDLEGLADTCFAAAALRGARRDDAIAPAAVQAELTRLAVGFAYALYVYFGRAQRPDPAVTRAARVTTPVRAAGLVVAGAGRRRAGTALLVGGCAWSLVAVARALAAG